MTNYAKAAGDILARIRAHKPVVHSLTNYVVMNSTANVLLAMGASPIMAHAAEEVEEIVAIASVLVINIGTLSQTWVESMKLACRAADRLGKPYVLDPVGSGATRLRTETARAIIQTAVPTVIRGNASEILSLTDQGGKTRGVDSIHSTEEAIDSAREIATSLGATVAVTGEQDLVTDGKQSLIVTGGHSLLSHVTGTGCAATVIIAAFLAEEENPMIATAAALAFFGLAAERAAVQARNPGTFWIKTLDEPYAIKPQELEKSARIAKYD